MNFLGREHNRERILPLLKETGDQLIALSDLSILVSASFVPRGLLHVDGTISSIAYFAIMTDKHYAFYNIPAMVTLGPCEINETVVEEQAYFEFKYKKGDVLIENLNLVQQDSLIYHVNDEMVAKGNIPPYQSYDNVNHVMRNTKYYTGITVGATANTMDYFYSIIGRSAEDPSLQTRNAASGGVDWISFRDIGMTANTTMARVVGSYTNSGIDVALVTKTDSVQKTEALLRS